MRTPTCEAVTSTGTRCRLVLAFVVTIDGQDRRLCGRHAKLARRHPIALCGPDHREADVARAGDGWTAEDDDVIRANPDLDAAELARRLGRTVWAVKSRRVRLRHRARGQGKT